MSALGLAGGLLTALTAAVLYAGRRRSTDAQPSGDEGTLPVAAAPSTEKPRGLTRQDIWSALGALGGILTLITAVMFYFGFRRAFVQANAMSIDVSLFGFSTQDYVLRSISSLYLPILAVFALILGWLWLHTLVVQQLRPDRLTSTTRRNTIAAWTLVVGVGGIVVAVSCLLFTAATVPPSRPAIVNLLGSRLATRQWVVPLLLITATLVAAYALWIHRQVRSAGGAEDRPTWQTLLPAVLVAGVVVLSAFWILEEYATTVGRRHALELSSTVNQLARAVVISPTPLGLDVPGVKEERLAGPDGSEVRYRVTGLRLLARSGDKVLLVHDNWAPGHGSVVVLPNSEQLSWQFSR